MDIEIRPITESEFPTFVRVVSTSFGEVPNQEEIEAEQKFFEFNRSLAAFLNGEMVGTSGIYSFEMTTPGSLTTPAAGVSYVGVLPTHRRRGILRAMMQRQLAEIQAKGEAIAILTASESSIYGRFGYGLATTQVNFEIDKSYTSFTRPIEAPGTVRLVDKDEARTIIPPIFDQVRRQRPGSVNRTEKFWDHWFLDPESWRHGASARFYVVYTDPSGAQTGYMAYRIKVKWEHGTPQSTLIVGDFMSTTPDAFAALWQFAAGVDLVRTIELHNRPSDEPLRWMLADPRRLRHTAVADFLWLRPVDVAAALRARHYLRPGKVIFHIEDPFLPENTGNYELDGAPDGATCRRTDASPDISLCVDDLGAAYLGGVYFSTLARAGRVAEHTPGSLVLADGMFTSDPPAWATTAF